MILHFQSEGDSVLVSAAQIAAIREINSDLFVIYLAGGEEICVSHNDYNQAAGALWQEYIEGGQSGR